METKLKSNPSNFEVIDYIQRDLEFNKRINFSDMIEYIKSELHIYLKTDDIDQTDSTYSNRFGQTLKLTTIVCKNLNVIIREKITSEADVKFVSLDSEGLEESKNPDPVEEL